MKKAVILFSGGLDSTTCLAIAKSEGYQCFAISFDYGQKQLSELEAATNIAKKLGAFEHKVINIKSISEIAKSALTRTDIEIPDYNDSGEIPPTYVPARNTIFFSFALAYAESIEADSIFHGGSIVDYSGYPDCRPEYYVQLQKLFDLATKAGIEGHGPQIKMPLVKLSKAETIALGLKLGVDYSHTITCYRANSKGEACGTCDSCYLRKKGFKEANIADPTKYIDSYNVA